MKIGFLGNANNYPLMYARELKKLGYEIEFVLAQNYILDRPENKYSEYTTYPSWMHNLIHWDVWKFSEQDPKKMSKAVKILSKCDLVILNQYYICLAPYIQRPWIAMLTGTDILTLCVKEEVINWYANSKYYKTTRSIEYKQAFIYALNRMEEQRYAIRNAMFTIASPLGVVKTLDAILEEMGFLEEKRFAPALLIDTKREKEKIFSNTELKIAIISRLNWDKSKKDLTELDYKGTDVFLKGFASFVSMYPTLNVKLYLFRKGQHIQETIELIQSLGIEKYCIWKPELTQKEFSLFLQEIDVAVDQIGISAIAMAGLEALSYGTPLIATDTLPAYGVNNSPILDSKTPEEVAKNLEKLLDLNYRKEIGQKSIECIRTYFSVEKKAKELSDWIERLYPKFEVKENFYLTVKRKQERRNKLLEKFKTQFYISKLIYINVYSFFEELQSKYKLNLKTGEIIIPKEKLIHEQGFCYLFHIPELEFISDKLLLTDFEENLSPVLLYENKIRLTPHSFHEEIRKLGEGRFSHWGRDFYFSSTDGTDPRFNNKIYKIKLRGIKKFLERQSGI